MSIVLQRFFKPAKFDQFPPTEKEAEQLAGVYKQTLTQDFLVWRASVLKVACLFYVVLIMFEVFNFVTLGVMNTAESLSSNHPDYKYNRHLKGLRMVGIIRLSILLVATIAAWICVLLGLPHWKNYTLSSKWTVKAFLASYVPAFIAFIVISIIPVDFTKIRAEICQDFLGDQELGAFFSKIFIDIPKDFCESDPAEWNAIIDRELSAGGYLQTSFSDRGSIMCPCSCFLKDLIQRGQSCKPGACRMFDNSCGAGDVVTCGALTASDPGAWVCQRPGSIPSQKVMDMAGKYGEAALRLHAGAAFASESAKTMLPMSLSLLAGAVKGSWIAKILLPASRVPGFVMAAALMFCLPLLGAFLALFQNMVGHWLTMLACVFSLCAFLVFFPTGDLVKPENYASVAPAEKVQSTPTWHGLLHPQTREDARNEVLARFKLQHLFRILALACIIAFAHTWPHTTDVVESVGADKIAAYFVDFVFTSLLTFLSKAALSSIFFTDMVFWLINTVRQDVVEGGTDPEDIRIQRREEMLALDELFMPEALGNQASSTSSLR